MASCRSAQMGEVPARARMRALALARVRMRIRMPGAGGRGAHGGTAGDASIEERAGTSGIHDFPGGGGSGGSERNDQGGSGGVVVAPGQLREACIPGGLVTEADGSPAKAEINTLIRCDEGLSCNAQGKCALAPACPPEQWPVPRAPSRCERRRRVRWRRGGHRCYRGRVATGRRRRQLDSQCDRRNRGRRVDG